MQRAGGVPFAASQFPPCDTQEVGAALCVVFAGCAKAKRGPPWFGSCFSIGRAHSIEYLYKDISRIHRSHEGLSLTTTAGDVVVVVKTVDSNQIARHAANYRRDLLDNPLIEHRDEWGTRANQSRLAYSGSCESKRVECRHD